MQHTISAPLKRISFNPYRDLSNYPIDEATVESLMGSFEEVGNFSTLPARPDPFDPSKYQIAAGHHRLSALQRLGIKDVELTVADYDDDQMIEIMTVENSTQRGHNAAALLDSVAAITKRLAYLLLFNEPDDVWTIVQSCFPSKKSAEIARGLLLKGKGIGAPLILSYAPDGALKEKEVKEAIATLKADGRLNAIIEEVQAEVDAELEVIEAAERAAAAEAEKAAEAQRKAAERAKKAAEKAKAEADAAKRKQAEAEAKRQKEAEKAAAERARRQRKRKADVDKAASKKHTTTMASGVGRFFANANQLNAFRKVCEENGDILPLNSQEALAKKMIKQLGSDISGKAIREWVNTAAHDTRIKQRATSAKEKAEIERRKAQASFDSQIDTIQRGVNLIMGAVVSANSLSRKHEGISRPAGAVRLKQGIKKLIVELQKLEGRL